MTTGQADKKNKQQAGQKLAVLFDCDGVLVNSEELAFETDHIFMAERFGLHYTRAEYIAMSSGVVYEEFIARLRHDHRKIHGRDVPPDFENILHARYKELMEKNLRQIPQVGTLLQDLQAARVPYAVCTNAALPGTLWKLDKVGLRHYFNQHVYSKDMVKRPKPFPDIYLHGAQKLGVDPRQCFVVEDSVTGAQAGVAAGATVIGYTGGSHRFDGYDRQLKRAGAAFTTSCMKDAGRFILSRVRRGGVPSGPG